MTNINPSTNKSKNVLFDIAAKLIDYSVSNEDIKSAFSISINSDESIYDALIRNSIASNYYEAVVLIGKRFPPSNDGTTWGDLAKWVVEYNSA